MALLYSQVKGSGRDIYPGLILAKLYNQTTHKGSILAAKVSCLKQHYKLQPFSSKKGDI